jgi:hypothetical protein
MEHGPNFLEPPPDIIEGQPKWEVEAIVGMRYYGLKRQKQYQVHWKGYSNAEDTWEPENNIHAHELIAQYHRDKGMNIRATKIVAEGIMFPESQLTIPEQITQPSVPDSPQSVVTNPDIAVALAQVETQLLLPTAITKLAQVAQDRETQSEVQREAEEHHLLSLGTQAPNDKTHHIPDPRKNIPRRDTPRPRGNIPSNSEEAARASQLFRNPVVKDIENLGPYRPAMGDNSSKIPDPPWFLKPDLPHIPKVTAVNEHGQTVTLPYIRYALIDYEPMLLGTAPGEDGIYADYLRVHPVTTLPIETSINDGALEDLYTDYPFNWSLYLALYKLGDAGVIADVHQYRSSYLKLKYMQQENARITRILVSIQKEQEQHNSELAAFLGEVTSIRERLEQARVMSRVAPILRQLFC